MSPPADPPITEHPPTGWDPNLALTIGTLMVITGLILLAASRNPA